MLYLSYGLIAVFILVVILALLLWISMKQFELIHSMLRLTLMEEVHRTIREEISKLRKES